MRLATTLAVILLALSAAVPADAQLMTYEQFKKWRLTPEKYQRVTPGMTYDEVIKIIGVAGSEAASSRNSALYTWSDINSRSMSVMIINGRVLSKSQVGLQ